MPAPGSEQSKCTVTGLLFHPFAFGAGVSVALIDGGPKSILIASLVADAVFPALSVTVPMTVLMPSAVVTWSDGQVSTPDPGSTHRSEEHTSELQSQSNLVCRLLLEKKKK